MADLDKLKNIAMRALATLNSTISTKTEKEYANKILAELIAKYTLPARTEFVCDLNYFYEVGEHIIQHHDHHVALLDAISGKGIAIYCEEIESKDVEFIKSGGIYNKIGSLH